MLFCGVGVCVTLFVLVALCASFRSVFLGFIVFVVLVFVLLFLFVCVFRLVWESLFCFLAFCFLFLFVVAFVVFLMCVFGVVTWWLLF